MCLRIFSIKGDGIWTRINCIPQFICNGAILVHVVRILPICYIGGEAKTSFRLLEVCILDILEEALLTVL
jgi:hypothetical protein